MENIIEKLLEYDDLYYNKGDSPISDEEYDLLKEKAKEIFPHNSYFELVGSPVFGNKVKLPFVLGSLKKIKIGDISKWLEEHGGTYLITTKLDGVSFYVEYRNGKVYQSYTRGDGYYGQDITKKAKIFCPEIKQKGILKVRGELMLLDNIHERLNFKNARNGVAGIINRDDTKNCKHITPMFYEIIEGVKGNEVDKYYALCDFFKTSSVPGSVVYEHDKRMNHGNELKNFLEKCKENTNYKIDGLVITPVNYKRENVLKPENKICFKINEEGVKTTVIDIEWNTTRTGRVVPVVIIEPINIQGVTINRTTGFNCKFIEDNKIGKGSEVLIKRAGDCIPFISEVITKSPNFFMPYECPSCGEKLISKGVDILCLNKNCRKQAYFRVEHFLHRMGTENITHKTLMKLGLDTIEKCYEIDEWEIASIDGFGMKRAQQIVDEIQKTLYTTPDKLIAAFGIPGIGRTLGKTMSDRFDIDIKNFFLFTKERNNFIEINGMGDILVDNIMENRPKYITLYNFLLEKGMRFEEGEKILNGKQFCLTGKGDMGRKELQDFISSKGGIIKSSVSKTTNFLVSADPESNSSKTKKAKKYGTKIISYEELMEMLK